jgi:hypothetical protein
MEQCENLGFPIAELEADGSCTITKEENTGGEACLEMSPAHQVEDTNIIPGLCWYRRISVAIRGKEKSGI